jgi:DNA-binding beta-propeller fold protein YncE
MNTVKANVMVESSPVEIAFNKDGIKEYVAHWNNSTVTVIDTGTNTYS